jgi:thioesterase domain-containing protein
MDRIAPGDDSAGARGQFAQVSSRCAMTDRAWVARMLHIQGLLFDKPGGHEPPNAPVFFINGGIPDTFTFGVQAVCLNVGAMMIEKCGYDVGDIASCLLDRIRLLQPHGPYRLAGYCFGGLVTLEIARYLQESGEQVALLCLIELPHPATMRRLRFARMLLYYLERPTRVVAFIRRNLSAAVRRWRGPGPDAAERNLAHLLTSTFRASQSFVSRPYNGRIVLIYGDQSRSRFFADSGWRDAAAGGLDIRVIRGAHQLEDLLAGGELAKAISQIILSSDRADRPAWTPPTDRTRSRHATR